MYLEVLVEGNMQIKTTSHQEIREILKQARELSDHILKMKARAEEEGLFLGIGYNPSIPKGEQEGPMVRELYSLAKKLHDLTGG